MHYVCSDIHGRWKKYQAMLEGLDMGEEDLLYVLGDVIDRGPDGIRILQDIMKWANISFLWGNHELFLYGFIRSADEDWMEVWFENGGQATAEAFLRLEEREQEEILEFLEDSYVAIPNLCVAGKNYYLVHAFPSLHYVDSPILYSDIKEPEESRLWDMFWKRVDNQNWNNNLVLRTIYEMGRTVVIGHTITTAFSRLNCDDRGRAQIHHDKYFIGLDCGCARKDDRACLGVLRLEDGKEFYF